jgi:hypothetical protein
MYYGADAVTKDARLCCPPYPIRVRGEIRLAQKGHCSCLINDTIILIHVICPLGNLDVWSEDVSICYTI